MYFANTFSQFVPFSFYNVFCSLYFYVLFKNLSLIQDHNDFWYAFF